MAITKIQRTTVYFLIFPIEVFLVFSPLEGVGGDKVAGRCGVSPHGEVAEN
jgi:hypothetical protein